MADSDVASAPKRRRSAGKLTPRQQRFVLEYLIDCNATQAAIRAGYSARTANRIGPRLLSHVGVRAAIKQGGEKVMETLELTAERVHAETAAIAFSTEIAPATRIQALTLASKLLGLLSERVQHDGEIRISWAE